MEEHHLPIQNSQGSHLGQHQTIILVQIGMPNFRTLNFNKENNEVKLRLNLDLLDERMERAEV